MKYFPNLHFGSDLIFPSIIYIILFVSFIKKKFDFTNEETYFNYYFRVKKNKGGKNAAYIPQLGNQIKC